jgi:hypothetical protein
LGAFIPFISLFTMIYQYRVLKSDGTTAYDIGKYAVSSSPISFLRYASAIGLAILFMVGNVLLSAQDKIDAANFARGQTWINPFNQAKVDIPRAGWLQHKPIALEITFIFSHGQAKSFKSCLGESLSARK